MAAASALLYEGVPSPMPVDADARAYDALSQHPRAADLATIARSVLTAAVQVKRGEPRPDRVAKIAAEMRLARDDAATPFGNALDVLERGPEDEAQRTLARALAAYAVALFPPKDQEEEGRVADDLLWLATHTPFDATGLVDRALGDAAAGVWNAMAERVRRSADATYAGLGRGEVLVACVALASSGAPAAAKQAAALAAELRDPKLSLVLQTCRGADPVEPVLGEIAPPPRGPFATTLLAVTGVLLAMHVVRLVGRLALAYRKPAQVLFVDDGLDRGVRVRWRVEMLGRTLRDRDVLVPMASLARASREVRYPRAALYAGLLSLAFGSYVGASAFADGVRAASPSLLACGMLVVALGVALEFGLSSIAPSARGRCRMLIVPRDGSGLCVSGVETRLADALLSRLARS